MRFWKEFGSILTFGETPSERLYSRLSKAAGHNFLFIYESMKEETSLSNDGVINEEKVLERIKAKRNKHGSSCN